MQLERGTHFLLVVVFRKVHWADIQTMFTIVVCIELLIMHSLFKKRKLKFSFPFCSFLLNSYMSLIKHNIAQYYSRGKTCFPSPSSMLCCSCAAFPNEHARSLGFSLLSLIPDCLTSEPSGEGCVLTPPYNRRFQGAVEDPDNGTHWTISRMAVGNECNKAPTLVSIPFQVRAMGKPGVTGEEEQLAGGAVGDSVQAPSDREENPPCSHLEKRSTARPERSAGGRSERLCCISLYGSAVAHRNKVAVAVPTLLRRN